MITYLLVAVSVDLGYVLNLPYMHIYWLQLHLRHPATTVHGRVDFLAFFLVSAGGRPSSSPESHLQKIGFLKVPVPGRASPLLALFVRARWRLCACCCLLLSPVRSSLSHCDAVPPPMAVTYRRTTVRRAFRYLSIIVKTNYGGGVVGGLL